MSGRAREAMDGEVIEIDSEAARARLLARLRSAALPCLVQIQDGARRSCAQNAAYRALIGAIAAATGNEPAMLHRHFGRRFLSFEEDGVGEFTALVPVSTRSLTTGAMSALIERVHALAAWLGIETDPGAGVQRIGHVDRDGVMHARAPQEETGEGVEAVLRRLEARFGEGVVTLARAHAPIAVIPTGSPALDTALGIGGLPRGRIVEIYGPEASGKTSLALGIIAEAQRGGGTCAFIDAEHALDDGYAARLGVDPNRLLLSRPDTGEQALEITEQLICCGGVAVVVVDSVAALTPRAERQAGIGQAPPGLQARLMSQGLRRLAAPAARAGCTVIFINQMRRALGAWQGFSQTTPGGYALRFYASVRLELSVAAPLRRGGEIVGTAVTVRVVKNKLAPPFRCATLGMHFSEAQPRRPVALSA